MKLRLSSAMLGTLLAGSGFAQPAAPKYAHLAPQGPYRVTVEAAPGLPGQTLYRPSDLARVPAHSLPIVAWGNGGCSGAGRGFEQFLTTVASHGYVVVVPGKVDAPPPAWLHQPPRMPEPGKPMTLPTPETNAAQLVQAIDWAIAQDGQAGGPLAGKLDTAAVAVMGQSCGGLMAIEASRDPRVRTSMIFDSGVLPPGGPFPSTVTKADLAGFHAPVAYIMGGPTDIAYANAEDDYRRITGVPVFKANLDVGHPGTFFQPTGGWFAEVATNWLAWQLKKDPAAATMFTGADCTLCRNPIWSVERKNF